MRLLVVRFSAIGDCAMAAWPVSALRREGVEIGWAVEAQCAGVLSADLADVYPVARKAPGGIGQGLRKERGHLLGLVRAARVIRAQRFPVALDLQGHAKTAVVLRLSGAKRRFVLDPRDPVAAKVATTIRGGDGHEVERAAEALGRVASELGLSERFPAGLPLDALPIMPRPAEVEPGSRPLALIAVAAGKADKALPAPTTTAVARALVAEGWRVEMIGGPTDLAPPDLGGATDRVGEMSLRQTVERIGQASLVVAGDTGSGHIAAALGVRTVSVFGPTDPSRYHPWGSRAVVLRRGTSVELVSAEEVVAETLAAARGAVACAS